MFFQMGPENCADMSCLFCSADLQFGIDTTDLKVSPTSKP